MVTAVLCTIALQSSAIRWCDDQPRAVIAALKDGKVTAIELSTIVATEGYKRLKERELGMKRSFTEEDFAEYLESTQFTWQEYEQTLNQWSKIDFASLISRAKVYLPTEANIRVTVYPLIKPRPNSFVWDTKNDPAMMIYMNPEESVESVASTIVHEIHHIGYSSCCPSKEFETWSESIDKRRSTAWNWVAALGEGYAVLAAAIDRRNPVGFLGTEERAAWNNGMKNMSREFGKLETFFASICEGKLNEENARVKAMEFYGLLGPWYTVGFVMATTIEDAFGKAVLFDCYKDPRKVFETYNQAVQKLGLKYPAWSQEFLATMK